MRVRLRLETQLLACLAVALRLDAQAEWTSVGPAHPQARWRAALAYDSARGRTVLFGGDRDHHSSVGDHWEWDGTSWAQRAPVTLPTPRLKHAMAFDSARGRLVLFGGDDVNLAYALGDTWEWDGTVWRQIQTVQPPQARSGHAMAYDPVRQRVVMFGGGLFSQHYNDTWEWDGTRWRQVRPPRDPGTRVLGVMAWHAPTGRVVLFGGYSAGSLPSDTWLWDGTTWSPASPTRIPPGRYEPGLAPSAGGQLVLFGGYPQSGNPTADTWEWDGSNWTARTPATSPGARAGMSVAWDAARNRTVLVGGVDGLFRVVGDTWEWDGTNWSQRAAIASPGARMWPGFAADPMNRSVLLFGGTSGQLFGDTWSWDGTRWRDLQPFPAPPARTQCEMVTDTLRGRVVLYGGQGGGGLNDTWEWNGARWKAMVLASAPTARHSHALAFDSGRGRVVLFGGVKETGTRYLDETWEWNGTRWSQRLPAVSPPARIYGAMAYDEARRRTVLFGGRGTRQALADTWEWDGTTWAQRLPATSPLLRTQHRMVYDVARARVVLFGGEAWGASVVVMADTWEWDGTTWSQRATPTTPPARYRFGLAYEPYRERVVLFGGLDAPRLGALQDTWEYASATPAAWSPYGAGCRGSGGVPALVADRHQRPWIADRFSLGLVSLPANAACLLFVGTSRTSWNGIALPLDLTGPGMPGCSLLARPTIALPLAASGSTAQVDLDVPDDRALLGSAFFAQALVRDPPANAFGATTSNAGQGWVGQR